MGPKGVWGSRSSEDWNWNYRQSRVEDESEATEDSSSRLSHEGWSDCTNSLSPLESPPQRGPGSPFQFLSAGGAKPASLLSTIPPQLGGNYILGGIWPGSVDVVSCTFVLGHVYMNCTYYTNELLKYHYMCEMYASMYSTIETN